MKPIICIRINDENEIMKHEVPNLRESVGWDRG